MADENGELVANLVFCVAIGLIGSLAWTPVSDRFSDKLTAYPSVCRSGVAGPSTCPGGRWVAEKEQAIFAVIPAQQTVVAKYGQEAPARLGDCTVMDRENWDCGIHRAVNGAVSAGEGDWMIFIPRWRWYLLKYLDVQPSFD